MTAPAIPSPMEVGQANARLIFLVAFALVAVWFVAWLWARHPVICILGLIVVAFGVTQHVTKALAVPPDKHKGIEQSRPAGKGNAGKVARVAYDVGFRGRGLETAVAVALAESGGRPSAHCLNCVRGIREDSRGLWQVNARAHPKWGQRNLYDSHTNARAAYAISGGGRNWRPWSTWKSGSYRRHLPAARRAVGRVR
jgi:hypothetical protein